MIIVTLILLGLCFGSFVNALVFRLHEQSKQSKAKGRKLKARNHSDQDFSILKGRSMCVHCHHGLAWYDLLPVISWISLKGKCRYCKKQISLQYPVVELVTAALLVASYLYWPYNFDLLGVVLLGFWCVFLTLFVAMAVYDLRWMLLPNTLTFAVTILAVMQVFLHALLTKDFMVLTEAVYGLLSVGGLFYVLFQVSSGKWIGGGDVKLGFAIGLLAGGFVKGLLLLFIASLVGTVVVLPTLGAKGQKLKKRIPFGPFLIVATIFVYLFGQRIIDWYSTQLVYL